MSSFQGACVTILIFLLLRNVIACVLVLVFGSYMTFTISPFQGPCVTILIFILQRNMMACVLVLGFSS